MVLPRIFCISWLSKFWLYNFVSTVDYKNRHNLELIERSLCIICLDESFPIAFNYNQAEHHSTHNTNSGRDETNMAHQMLHGGGSNLNSGNRWFDKPIQVRIIMCYRITNTSILNLFFILVGNLQWRCLGSLLRAFAIGRHCCDTINREINESCW